MNILSLCSGMGGLELGAEMAGNFNVVAFCEKEAYPKAILQKRWPEVKVYDDINDITKEKLRIDGIDKIDIITAGIPCQPFSVAGKRNGEEDERHLWPIVKNIVADIRPKYFILENVRGLLSIQSMDGVSGGVFGQILIDLLEIGYCSAWFVYGAADVGAPHQRQRVFIVANSNN